MNVGVGGIVLLVFHSNTLGRSCVNPHHYTVCKFLREAIKPGTEPEVIDAQYGHGRRIRDVLICHLIKVERAHLASCTSHHR